MGTEPNTDIFFSSGLEMTRISLTSSPLSPLRFRWILSLLCSPTLWVPIVWDSGLEPSREFDEWIPGPVLGIYSALEDTVVTLSHSEACLCPEIAPPRSGWPLGLLTSDGLSPASCCDVLWWTAGWCDGQWSDVMDSGAV